MQAIKQNKIILHVDDDEDDRQLVKESVLEYDRNTIIHEVDNGKAALFYLQQARIHGDLPSLIILDLNMPVMNGYDFLKEIKKDAEFSSIPVIIFTTSTAPFDKGFAKKYGVEFFTKPPTIKELSEAVKKILSLLSLGYAIINMRMMCHIKM